MNRRACQEVLEARFASARLPQEVKDRYLEVLEQKWDKVLECIRGDRAFQYVFLPSGLRFWLILGSTDEYLILSPHYCSCHDFYFNAVLKRREVCCYHIVAQIICQMTNRFVTICKEDSVYLDYIEELLERD